MSMSVRSFTVLFLITALAIFGIARFVWLETDDLGYLKTFGIRYHEDEHALPPLFNKRVSAQELVAILGEKRAKIFAQLDTDWNGLLTLPELDPLIHHIRQNQSNSATKHQKWLAAGAPCTANCTELRYQMSSLRKCIFLLPNKSLSTFPAEEDQLGMFNFGKIDISLTKATKKRYVTDSARVKDILENQKPMDDVKSVNWRHFNAFLPPKDVSQQPGSVYPLVLQLRSEVLTTFYKDRHRYTPGHSWSAVERDLRVILHKLHPNVFLHSHSSSGDSYAVVRAVNRDRMEILFRVNAELQLVTEPSANATVLYMMPTGLLGRVVLDRSASQPPVYFKMHLSSDGEQGHRNVGLEWPMTVFKLFKGPPSGQGSCLLDKLNVELKEQKLDELSKIKWEKSITPLEAMFILNKEIIPYFRTTWYSGISNCLSAAKLNKKPIHMLAGFGALPGQASLKYFRFFRRYALENDLINMRLKYDFVNCWMNLAEEPLNEDTFGAAAAVLDKLVRSRAHLPLTTLVIPYTADHVVDRMFAPDLDELMAEQKKLDEEEKRKKKLATDDDDDRDDEGPSDPLMEGEMPKPSQEDPILLQIYSVLAKDYIKFLDDTYNTCANLPKKPKS